MTLRHLRIFVAVCKWKSITKAAEKLHIAQPSVSLAIKELESYYHLQLFDRISRKLFLTSEGERFLTYASHIISLFDEMEEGIQHWGDMGQLIVGSSITIANSLLCDCLLHYKALYPRRKTQILIKNSQILETAVIENEIDIALMEGIPTHPQIQTIPFFQDELAIICANDHELAQKPYITLEDIAEENFLLREKGSGTRDIVDSIMKIHNMQIRPIWESASTRALVKGVQHGFGISILPYQMVKDELANKLVTRLMMKDISLERKYYIIYHVNKHLHSGLLDFIRCCQEVAANKS